MDLNLDFAWGQPGHGMGLNADVTQASFETWRDLNLELA